MSVGRVRRRVALAGLVVVLGCGGDGGTNVVPPPPGNFTVVVGEDWNDYTSTADLRANTGWGLGGGGSGAQYVDWVSDPVFAHVARITQPANCSPGALGISPEHRRNFTPRDKLWFRWRMRYSPGWTTVGPEPVGSANAYKVAFITWSGMSGRQETVISNTDKYGLGVDQASVTRTEAHISTQGWLGTSATPEWAGTEWWEFIMYFQRLSPTQNRGRWWKRQLTQAMAIVDNPFEFDGWEQTATSGTFVPAGGIAMGVNKNNCTPTTQYIYWGPYDVVDGSVFPDPFGVGP